MEELDLDAFIANIEETAPDDNLASKLTCKDCNVQLEEGEDGNYVCPNCSAQATGILQLDDTELHHDDQGRPVFGQRVRTVERTRRHRIDYGWAWSTDDVVAHILQLQVEALEKANLLPQSFRSAVTNMWLKFWLENIAPHIKDSYNDEELVPIKSRRTVKFRDIEVLVKVRDKIMAPTPLVRKPETIRTYNMYGSQFFTNKPDEDSLTENFDGACRLDDGNSSSVSSISSIGVDRPNEPQADLDLDAMSTDEVQANVTPEDLENHQGEMMDVEDEPCDEDNVSCVKTRNLSDESIAILTLNRTLAFIEATARTMDQEDPLFASDIIRACNQRLIPFYNASKLLPDGMNLNLLDKLMFQKTRPPTPVQLTRAATLLIHKVYHDHLPKTLPIPNLSSILKRFIKDLNLPNELYHLIKDDYSFFDFQQTRPMIFTNGVKRRLPQYDRWAFAVLLGHMKRLFNLGSKYITLQGERAQMETRNNNEFYFDINCWLNQISLRLDLILRYDAFVLLHPMAEVEKLECTPQMSKYIELILDDRASATIRSHANAIKFDEGYRTDLADFINRQLLSSDNSMQASEDLDHTSQIKLPLTDAYQRTRRFWAGDIEKHPDINEIIHKNFRRAKLLIPDSVPAWCIYDKGSSLTRGDTEISPNWPEGYRVLLNVGAFICFCDPIELMDEVKQVEQIFFPQTKIRRRINAAQRRR